MRKASQLTGPTGGSSSHPVSTALTRRRFLFALSATGAGAAAAPALAAAKDAATAVEPAKATGYRETEHVRDYYDSARI